MSSASGSGARRLGGDYVAALSGAALGACVIAAAE
jgi:hypothetical protein